MKAIDYLKEKARLTNGCDIHCRHCRLYQENNGKSVTCRELQAIYPEQAIEIVEKWAKENPGKTYKTELLKRFPKFNQDDEYLTDYLCRMVLFDGKTGCNRGDEDCTKCWNEEYKEACNDN